MCRRGESHAERNGSRATIYIMLLVYMEDGVCVKPPGAITHIKLLVYMKDGVRVKPPAAICRLVGWLVQITDRQRADCVFGQDGEKKVILIIRKTSQCHIQSALHARHSCLCEREGETSTNVKQPCLLGGVGGLIFCRFIHLP